MKRLLDRSITFLVVPPADFRLWRASLSLKTTLGLAAAWTLLTLWMGFRAARQADYVATKADNGVLKARIARLVDAVERSGDDLVRAKEADRQLRKLLEMPSKDAIIKGEEGTGGPAAWDQRDILRRFADDPAHVSPALVERSLDELRLQSRERVDSTAEIFKYVDRKHALFRSTPLGWPAEGRITSSFGYRFSPLGGDDGDSDEFHPGLDIANRKGTEILATADGVVERAGWAGGYGKMIFIRHGEGYATLFGHTSQLLVRAGDRVRRGRKIALMGSTGRSTGSHVHYEVWRNGKQINPAHFLKRDR